MARKWNIIYVNSKGNYNTGNEVIRNTDVLKSKLCNYDDAYILVRGSIIIIGHQVTQVAFTNCAEFTKRVTKIDGTTIDDAEDSDLVIPMYNLIEYGSSYFETIGSLLFYSRVEATNLNEDIVNTMILNLSSIRLNY